MKSWTAPGPDMIHSYFLQLLMDGNQLRGLVIQRDVEIVGSNQRIILVGTQYVRVGLGRLDHQ